MLPPRSNRAKESQIEFLETMTKKCIFSPQTAYLRWAPYSDSKEKLNSTVALLTHQAEAALGILPGLKRVTETDLGTLGLYREKQNFIK